MKTLRIASTVTLVAVIFISVGIVSALQQSDAVVHSFLSTQTPKQGGSLAVGVTFQSTTDQRLHILRIGMHADWMEQDGFQGPNLASDPEVIEAQGTYTAQFIITVPTTASIGEHSYYIGVDVADDSGNTFSFDSASGTLQVVSSSGSSTGPTPTNNPGGGTGDIDWLPFIVVGAAAAVVVVLIVVTLMQRKRKPAAEPVAEQPASTQPDQPQPEQPEEKPSDDKEFTI